LTGPFDRPDSRGLAPPPPHQQPPIHQHWQPPSSSHSTGPHMPYPPYVQGFETPHGQNARGFAQPAHASPFPHPEQFAPFPYQHQVFNPPSRNEEYDPSRPFTPNLFPAQYQSQYGHRPYPDMPYMPPSPNPTRSPGRNIPPSPGAPAGPQDSASGAPAINPRFAGQYQQMLHFGSNGHPGWQGPPPPNQNYYGGYSE